MMIVKAQPKLSSVLFHSSLKHKSCGSFKHPSILAARQKSWYVCFFIGSFFALCKLQVYYLLLSYDVGAVAYLKFSSVSSFVTHLNYNSFVIAYCHLGAFQPDYYH